MNAKHVVMLNVETDVTVGVYLHELAKQVGCVYTVASGDEPGVCKMLYNFASTLGFEVVCLGKGKNNPINYYANPSTCEEEALSKGMNPKMLAAVPGWHQDDGRGRGHVQRHRSGCRICRERMALKSIWLTSTKCWCRWKMAAFSPSAAVWRFTTGKVAPGVFAIITSPDRRVRVDMKFLAMGDGPYYTLYRPYHLCNVETPISIAEAMIYGETHAGLEADGLGSGRHRQAGYGARTQSR